MALTILSPSTALGAGIFVKSTALRIQFALNDSDGAGGQLSISAGGGLGSLTLASLVSGQTLRALKLLSMFSEATADTPTLLTRMQDVEVRSVCAGAVGATTAGAPIGYNWNGNVGGTLVPFLFLEVPATAAGAIWQVTIELRNSLIG